MRDAVVRVKQLVANPLDVGAGVEEVHRVRVELVEDGLLAHANLEVCGSGQNISNELSTAASWDSPRRMIRMSHFISAGVIFETQRRRMRACSALPV